MAIRDIDIVAIEMLVDAGLYSDLEMNKIIETKYALDRVRETSKLAMAMRIAQLDGKGYKKAIESLAKKEEELSNVDNLFEVRIKEESERVKAIRKYEQDQAKGIYSQYGF